MWRFLSNHISLYMLKNSTMFFHHPEKNIIKRNHIFFSQTFSVLSEHVLNLINNWLVGPIFLVHVERATRRIIFICQLYWIWQLLSLIGLVGQKSFLAAHLTMSADAISQFGYLLPTVSLLLHIWPQCTFDLLYSREVQIFEVVQNGLWVNTSLQLPVNS